MTRLRPAERLLQELGIDDAQEIDLEAIAWYVGCRVRYRRLDGCEARIVGAGARAIISVGIDVAPVRRRFSLGHELGHFICRSDAIGNQARDANDPERVADGFAADLLLPAYIVQPLIARGGASAFTRIGELAAEFRTSTPATAIRYVDLSRQDLMLVCHPQHGRRWYWPGPRIPDRWKPRLDLDTETYAHEVLTGKRERSHVARMPAQAWFNSAEAERYELHEETIRSSEGILTILAIEDEDMMQDWSRRNR
jgi:hypothetical protein